MSQSGPPADAKQAQAAALQELEAAQKRKRAIDTSLANLEASIFAFEGSYLEETAASGGNIIKGFDNYLKPPTSGINKKKLDVTEQDRLFSTSSGTYQQSLDAKRQYEIDLRAIRQAINARKQQSEIPRPAPALPSAYGLASVDPRRCGIADTIDKHRCAVVLGTPIEGTKPAQISISIPQRLGASAPMPPVDDGAAVATMMMKEYLANSDSPTNSQAGSRKGGKGKKAEGIGRSFEAAFIEEGQ